MTKRALRRSPRSPERVPRRRIGAKDYAEIFSAVENVAEGMNEENKRAGKSERFQVLTGDEMLNLPEFERFHEENMKPRTAAHALACWDRGWNVFTVELGGFGPGYEQAIHIYIMEIVRAFRHLSAEEIAAMKDDDFRKSCYAALKAFDPQNDKLGGLSGAQGGAAESFAHSVLTKGWWATVELYPEDRRIQIGKFWPKSE